MSRNLYTYISLILWATAALFFWDCGGKEAQEENWPSQSVEKTQTGSLSYSETTAEKLPPLNIVRSIKVRNIGPLYKVFNDSNYLHLQTAKEIGIDPLQDIDSYYFMKRPIVKVSDNKYYHIDSLRHSLPYLVPEAEALLCEIGRNFIDSLHSRGGDSYTVKVTSLLRTPESVGRLRRVNVNASDSSTHQYATTFDISYTNFYCLDPDRQINQGDLKNLLAEVLQDLRQQGRCYVKFENKTGCFHITVRR